MEGWKKNEKESSLTVPLKDQISSMQIVQLLNFMYSDFQKYKFNIN